MAKICHFSTAHQAGDIRIVRKEASSAKAQGHEVTVVIRGELPADCGGVYHVKIEPPRGGRLARFVLMGWRVSRLALAQNADIYHFHDPDLLPYAWLMRLRGNRVIYDAHEDVPRDILSKEWIPASLRCAVSRVVEVVEDFVARRMSAVVTATPFIGERFTRINSNTVVVNNYPFGAELAPNVADGELALRQGFCYVGGISSIRSALEMVDACGICEHRLSMAGPFETQSIVTAMAQRSGWRNVDYLGMLPRDEVADLFARSIAGLVLFYPEPNHVNAQPNKLFEYMSAGLPVIVSNFPLWRNIVEKYDCGLCVDPLDPAMIAAAMDRLAAEPALARRMGANGRRAVLETFNWEREQLSLMDLYANLAGPMPVLRSN